MPVSGSALPKGLQSILIDAGFTLVTYDPDRIFDVARRFDLPVGVDAIAESEKTVRAELASHCWPHHPNSSSPREGGVRFFRRVVELGLVAPAMAASLDAAAEELWAVHLENNLWSRLIIGVPGALASLRAAGFQLAVVSNSEGTVESLIREIGLAAHFDLILDSWHVGVAKPHPQMFKTALRHLDVPADKAIMVGDSLSADIAGAQSAGVAAALVDPYDLHPDAACPRFATFADFAKALLAQSEWPNPE